MAEVIQTEAPTHLDIMDRADSLMDAMSRGETDAPQETPEQAQPEQQEQKPAYEDFDSFLRATNADWDSIKALPVTVKVDGKEERVPLHEALNSYSRQQDYTTKTQALANERQQFATERQTAMLLASEQVKQGRALGQVAQNLINQDYAQIDWNALKMQNPAQYAALAIEYQQRQSSVQQYLGQVSAQEQALAAKAQEESQGRLAQEQERMLSVRPEWRDGAKFTEAREGIVKLGRTLGFNDAELSGITDHRLMLMADMAARYAALQAKTPDAVNKVRAAPKAVAKPGSRTGAAPADQQRQAVFDRFRTNPRSVEAQEALADFLVNSGA